MTLDLYSKPGNDQEGSPLADILLISPDEEIAILADLSAEQIRWRAIHAAHFLREGDPVAAHEVLILGRTVAIARKRNRVLAKKSGGA